MQVRDKREREREKAEHRKSFMPWCLVCVLSVHRTASHAVLPQLLKRNELSDRQYLPLGLSLDGPQFALARGDAQHPTIAEGAVSPTRTSNICAIKSLSIY